MLDSIYHMTLSHLKRKKDKILSLYVYATLLWTS